ARLRGRVEAVRHGPVAGPAQRLLTKVVADVVDGPAAHGRPVQPPAHPAVGGVEADGTGPGGHAQPPPAAVHSARELAVERGPALASWCAGRTPAAARSAGRRYRPGAGPRPGSAHRSPPAAAAERYRRWRSRAGWSPPRSAGSRPRPPGRYRPSPRRGPARSGCPSAGTPTAA